MSNAVKKPRSFVTTPHASGCMWRSRWKAHSLLMLSSAIKNYLMMGTFAKIICCIKLYLLKLAGTHIFFVIGCRFLLAAVVKKWLVAKFHWPMYGRVGNDAFSRNPVTHTWPMDPKKSITIQLANLTSENDAFPGNPVTNSWIWEDQSWPGGYPNGRGIMDHSNPLVLWWGSQGLRHTLGNNFNARKWLIFPLFFGVG